MKVAYDVSVTDPTGRGYNFGMDSVKVAAMLRKLADDVDAGTIHPQRVMTHLYMQFYERRIGDPKILYGAGEQFPVDSAVAKP